MDTNIISELIRPTPAEQVVDWVARQLAEDLFLTAVSEAELRYGVAILPAGRRREWLLAQIDAILEWDFTGRILPFNSEAARAYAVIASRRRGAGLPISMADCHIAAIARSMNATIATRDTSGFRDCRMEVVKPWLALGKEK